MEILGIIIGSVAISVGALMVGEQITKDKMDKLDKEESDKYNTEIGY